MIKPLTGNYAAAWGARLARVGVVSAYPITPQTTIVEKLAEFIERGEMDARIIRVESEHSALSAAWGAALGGVRAFTATASHGLLYMHEMLWWAAGSRIPLVMAVVTRTIGPPWNIWTDHSDIMGQRDTGWLIMMSEHNQEVLDSIIQMFKISEDPKVFLPGIVGLDGFILSHTTEPVDIPDQDVVDRFLPERRQPYILKPGDPLIMGNIPSDLRDNVKMRWDIHRSQERAKGVIRDVDREWAKLTGRSYGGLVERYRCDNAKYHIIGMGAWVGDMKEAVDILRDMGYGIGLVKVRYVRPFPGEEIAETLASSKGVIVFDRSVSPGSAGPLYLDVLSHAYIHGVRVPIQNVLAGIAGIDVGYDDIIGGVTMFINALEEGRWPLPSKIQWYFGGGEWWP
ncbi:MAG: pyruvate ferredoxin oxidoreductase [Desulfurococcales archaeon ex4484_204]|nr:MAG: pyruvate ferredoxin oxidoreductase [Desulfurococcales archaeon ex4484_204]